MWSFLSSSSTSLHRAAEFPLQALQEAITTQDEAKVWEVLRKQRIRDELAQSTTTHKVPNDPQQQKYNVFTCVEAAVHRNMPQVVLAMCRFNAADVRLATWYAIYRRKKTKQYQPQLKVSSELVALARAQRRVWLWDRIGAFLLLRQCKTPHSRASRRQDGEVNAVHPVATIPDEAFKIILSFVDLHESREARILQFLIEARPCPTCSRLCIPGHCKAKRLRKMERRASRRLSRS
ncbi:uncharacterized protein IUM83_04083 [Phytophthora cinnamomi]|uniref:uncharacterized protein n=1 Tax=Phytophthora cinnamomi TaxID=4785 RepID=UPI002A31ED8B|nr:hypothetical protein IUM83_04083 [Phytophthora cinnamomi]KAJ8523857.1 hypothetical protein ON010_g17261 [Phytophthora cinnamomi]